MASMNRGRLGGVARRKVISTKYSMRSEKGVERRYAFQPSFRPGSSPIFLKDFFEFEPIEDRSCKKEEGAQSSSFKTSRCVI